MHSTAILFPRILLPFIFSCIDVFMTFAACQLMPLSNVDSKTKIEPLMLLLIVLVACFWFEVNFLFSERILKGAELTK